MLQETSQLVFQQLQMEDQLHLDGIGIIHTLLLLRCLFKGN